MFQSPPPIVCYNSSEFLESVCNNHGTCANQTDAECECDGQYVKETYCRTTVSEELNNANFPLYVISAIAFAIVVVLTAYDFVIDLKLKAWPSVKRPIAIGKATLFVAAIALFFHEVIDYTEHSANSHEYADVTSVLSFFSDFLMLFSYSIATLSWISVILTAKGLGRNIKGLDNYRKFVLIANCILLPLYLVSCILTLIFDSEVIQTQTATVGAVVFIFYLTLMVGTSVFIRKSFVWIRSFEASSRTVTTRRVELKTYFLIGANLSACIVYVVLIASLVEGTTTAKMHLFRQVINLTIVVFYVFLLLVQENHIVRLPLYLKTGEIRSNTFLGGQGSSGTRPTIVTQSTPSSRKMKSSTESTRDLSSAHDELIPSRLPSRNGEEEDHETVSLSSSSPASLGSFEEGESLSSLDLDSDSVVSTSSVKSNSV
eukprot:TRINITY_DN947_c0_g3_i1.p1 TRINITY_DN947_c0_g3~~TRINITY_DN947_c0_g3_i1.p1  ORF type:complete len:472 (+),score=86.63 TRINITY_DN947_c0_g3_i1:127-1416(+)